MTRSFKADKQYSKSATVLGTPNLTRIKKDGAGKHSWGTSHDDIREGLADANDSNFYSSSPPHGGSTMQKIITIEEGKAQTFNRAWNLSSFFFLCRSVVLLRLLELESL